MEDMRRRLAEHWEEGRYCDVTLQTEEETGKIRAHKIILSSFSEYFAAMFNPDSKMVEGRMECVTLKQMQFDILEQVVRYAYTNKADFSPHNVTELFKTADFLQVERLCRECTKFMAHNICPQNCFETLEFANTFDRYDLKAAAYLFWQRNFGEISQSGATSCLTRKTLCELLTSNQLLISDVAMRKQGEMVVLNFVSNYIKEKDNLTLKDHAKLLSKVRLPYLPAAELDKLLQEKYIQQNSTCVRLVKHAKEQCLGNTRRVYIKSWDQPRKFAEIFLQNYRTWADGDYLNSDWITEITDFNDCYRAKRFGPVTGMRIWITKWRDDPVIGGIEMFYGYFGLSGIRGTDGGEMFEFHLKPGEKIVRAAVEKGWLLESLTFETNTGRQFGPYGRQSVGFIKEDPFEDGLVEGDYYLGYISGTVVDTQESAAITKLKFFWACEVDPEGSDNPDSEDDEESSLDLSFSSTSLPSSSYEEEEEEEEEKEDNC